MTEQQDLNEYIAYLGSLDEEAKYVCIRTRLTQIEQQLEEMDQTIKKLMVKQAAYQPTNAIPKPKTPFPQPNRSGATGMVKTRAQHAKENDKLKQDRDKWMQDPQNKLYWNYICGLSNEGGE
jgi:hypothetical protein